MNGRHGHMEQSPLTPNIGVRCFVQTTTSKVHVALNTKSFTLLHNLITIFASRDNTKQKEIIS